MEFEIKGIRFSTKELSQLTISLFVLSFAFSLVLYREKIFGPTINYNIFFFLESLIVVGLAFILHEEVGHKIVAQKYGYWAEYRAWPMGLFLAFFMAVISRGGFVFAAPGAVMISTGGSTSGVTKERMGKIAVAGPVVNIILCSLFVVLSLVFSSRLFAMAAQVNVWLALFNMIPIGMLDGAKVLRWDKRAWGAVLGISASLLFVSGTVLSAMSV